MTRSRQLHRGRGRAQSRHRQRAGWAADPRMRRIARREGSGVMMAAVATAAAGVAGTSWRRWGAHAGGGGVGAGGLPMRLAREGPAAALPGHIVCGQHSRSAAAPDGGGGGPGGAPAASAARVARSAMARRGPAPWTASAPRAPMLPPTGPCGAAGGRGCSSLPPRRWWPRGTSRSCRARRPRRPRAAAPRPRRATKRPTGVRRFRPAAGATLTLHAPALPRASPAARAPGAAADAPRRCVGGRNALRGGC